SRRRHTRSKRDWSSDVCSSDLFLFFNTGPANTILANVTHPSIRASAFALNIFLIHAMGDAPSPPMLGGIAGRLGWNTAFGVVTEIGRASCRERVWDWGVRGL